MRWASAGTVHSADYAVWGKAIQQVYMEAEVEGERGTLTADKMFAQFIAPEQDAFEYSTLIKQSGEYKSLGQTVNALGVASLMPLPMVAAVFPLCS